MTRDEFMKRWCFSDEEHPLVPDLDALVKSRKHSWQNELRAAISERLQKMPKARARAKLDAVLQLVWAYTENQGKP